MTTDFDEGLLVGILVGEGHFGGDGRQPQVTLRMHERHAPLFRWIDRTLPGGRLYGPYDHGGRRYYQWMARGPFLREVLLPILDRRLAPELDAYAYDRLVDMKQRYQRQLSSVTTREGRGRGRPTDVDQPEPPGASGADVPPGAPGPSTPGPHADPIGRIFSALRRPPSGPSPISS